MHYSKHNNYNYLRVKLIKSMKARINRKALKHTVYKAFYLWAHLDLNQGPPDYESGALTS